MTAKRSPLDFIINDSTARSDKQKKAREYAAAHTARRRAPSTASTATGGAVWAGAAAAMKGDSYLNTSCSVVTRSKDEEERFKKKKLLASHMRHVRQRLQSEVQAGKKTQEEGEDDHLSGLIQRGAQWHFGVIHISARLGPNSLFFSPRACCDTSFIVYFSKNPPPPHHPHYLIPFLERLPNGGWQ